MVILYSVPIFMLLIMLETLTDLKTKRNNIDFMMQLAI